MNKMRQWTLLTVAAVAVVFIAGWFLAVSKQRHNAAQFRAQTASQNSANATLATQVAQLQQQKKGLPEQQKLLANYATKIPDNPALPTLIRQLTAAAKASGVDLQSLSPAVPTAVATVPGATTSPAAGSALNQISLTLSVKGSYFNLESWFAAIEKLPRAMMVTQWSLSPAGPSTGTSGSGSSGSADASAPQDALGSMAATMTAIVYESPQAVPAAVTPAAAPATAK